MKELLTQNKTTADASLLVREYLQARILESLQRLGAFQNWAFLGGTALRFLYQLPRFSEDLDFSLCKKIPAEKTRQDSFETFMNGVIRTFKAETYQISLRSRSANTVQSAFVGFPGLLFELGLSPHREQNLSIKIELDTNPPEGPKFQTSLVRRHVFLNLLHYDRASLLSGKLHAILHRPHLKGRDLYDLLWYLSDPTWPEPNFPLLRSSLEQTGQDYSNEKIKSWRSMIVHKIEALNWDKVLADVAPFLEQNEDIYLLTRENILALLTRNR